MNDRKDRLVLMVGLPLSGKTTIVNRHFIPAGYAVVCPDDVRLALHGYRYVAKAEPFVWVIVDVMIDALLMSGNRVVVDATFTTEKRRAPFMVRFKPIVPVLCWVKTAEGICIERARERDDEEIIPVIERQAAQLEEPEHYFVVE
ncbi:MAG: ATP-binding protein [Nitrospiraceae bacterium]